MNRNKLRSISASVLSISLMLMAKGYAADSALPNKPEVQPKINQSVQPEIDKKAADAVAEKRKLLIADAQTAIAETGKALRSLEENKPKEAVDALAIATGKLELVLARNPTLALAPVDTTVVTQDVLSNYDTVKAVIK